MNNYNNNQDDNMNEPQDDRKQPAARYHSNNNNNGGRPPDYGEVLLGSDIRHAPKSLDHFKRGYQERAAQREKEFYTRRHGPDGLLRRHSGGGGGGGRDHRGGGGGGGGGRGGGRGRGDRGGGGGGRGRGRGEGPISNKMNNSNSRGGGGADGGEPWSSYRDRPTILQGLDINALADRLTPQLHSRDALFAELDRTRQQNEFVFESGKAMTALISVAARRKNIGLGHAVWDWVRFKNSIPSMMHTYIYFKIFSLLFHHLVLFLHFATHTTRWTTPVFPKTPFTTTP